MSHRLARILSLIFHPLLIPTYGILLIFSQNTYVSYSIPVSLKSVIFLVVFMTTLILPFITSYFLLRSKQINSFQMEFKEERVLPFISTAIYYLFGYYLLNQIDLPFAFDLIMLGGISCIIIALIINFTWKISIHLIGLGGIVGILLGLSQRLMLDLQGVIVVAIILSGFLGTARLIAGSHTPSQIYIGFIVGFLVMFSVLCI